MKKDLIKNAVNVWDPLGVYGFAPKNEYDSIVERILCIFEENMSDETMKNYLMNQYYSDNAKNESRVDELICLLKALKDNF